MVRATGSNAIDLTLPAPRGFRRRLTVAFVALAVVTGGVLATTSYMLFSRNRSLVFLQRVRRDAHLALLAAPPELTASNVGTLLDGYQRSAGIEAVAVVDGVTYSTPNGVSGNDIPTSLAVPRVNGISRIAVTNVGRVSYAVVAARPSDANVILYLFFPRTTMLDNIHDLREVLLIGWLISALVATIVGRAIARRTLRPVGDVATAASTLTDRLTGVAVDVPTDDEVATLTIAFNEMARAVTGKIDELTAMAERERRFTADVAHELRTPVTSLASLAEVLDDRVDEYPAHLRRPLQLVVRSVERLRHLVVDLLELARLDARDGGGPLEPLELVPALQQIIDELGEPVTVASDGADGLPVAARAQPARFQRVVRNIIENARHHAGGLVAVRVSRVGDRCVIDFDDAGPGIAPDDVDRVFDRFYKTDRSRSSHGSGLGLAIAREQARAQGGTLHAQARNPGTRFTFTLPSHDVDVHAPQRSA